MRPLLVQGSPRPAAEGRCCGRPGAAPCRGHDGVPSGPSVAPPPSRDRRAVPLLASVGVALALILLAPASRGDAATPRVSADEAGAPSAAKPAAQGSSASKPHGTAAQASGGGDAAPHGPVSARVFTIKFRDPNDVALLIAPQLSEQGSYTTVPKLRTVTVKDHTEILDRLQELIASYDVPPRNVTFTVTLIMASRAEEAGQSISREVRGITEALPDITRWTNYKTLDSATIAGSEGAKTARDLASEYRIDFTLESVSDGRGIIRLNPFSLMKAEKQVSGETSYRPVYTTTVNLKNDKVLTIGATKTETSPKALFLAIRAHIEGP